jgi:hypothetical protein
LVAAVTAQPFAFTGFAPFSKYKHCRTFCSLEYFPLSLDTLSKKRRPRRRAYGAATSRFRLRRTAAAAALWSLIFQFGSNLFEIYLNLGSSKAAAASEGTK